MNKALDATQLEFKKLDPENIDWVTIRGNHVPIPKNGSREQKAKAIKEWFANKKKDLPQAKGGFSVYSARFEHDQPERKAKRSGEGAEVHGSGQYTLRNIGINQRRYFDKFKRKSALPGTIFFTTFWLIGSWGFSLYVNNLSTYNIVFGTIGAFFILMIWLYYTSILLLIGGEMNSKVYNRLENKSKEIQEELEQLRKETFNR